MAFGKPGRPPSAKTLVDRQLKRDRPVILPAGESFIVPNHSGISSHPEFIEAIQGLNFVELTGDTMTGPLVINSEKTLTIQDGSANTVMDFERPSEEGPYTLSFFNVGGDRISMIYYNDDDQNLVIEDYAKVNIAIRNDPKIIVEEGTVTFPVAVSAIFENDATFNSSVIVAGDLTCSRIDTGNGMCELAAGTYTPTLTNVANLDASTAYSCQYMRVGNVVTVSGRVDVDPTTTLTSTQLGISLPIASNLANANECAGSAACPAIAGQSAAILGDATNDRAIMQWLAGDVTNQPMYFSFTYRII